MTTQPTTNAAQVRRPPVLLCNKHLHRIPEYWDLQPGLELLEVATAQLPYDPCDFSTKIRIDRIEPGQGPYGSTLFCHVVGDKYGIELALPAEDVVRLPTHRPRSWIPRLYWHLFGFEPQD